ncbi:MAG TPA: FapA family protein [Bacillota bacterium]|nr:FapA family protein [Bacillota bacterium]
MEAILKQDKSGVPAVNTPGRLGIIEGKVRMEKPKGLGSWPVIIPGENVEVYYEKERVTGPTVVEDANVLDIVTPSMPAKSTFEIEVSPDKMEVILVVTFKTGKIYAVEDHSFTRKLTVKAKVVTETPPKPIDPAGVFEELQRLGIEVPVYHDVVQQACSELKSGKFVIARGVPPVQPEDGRVQLVCDLVTKPVFPYDDERVDFRERMRIAAVEPGDVLAQWHPPKFGKPGRNVYGKEIVPRRPKDGMIRPGRGVKLVENGRIAVATISGRPVYRHGVLSVNQEIVIKNDVNMSTGNIRFTGDVTVLGDVADAMEVESGEIVDIKGSVYHARIRAGSHIRVGNKTIGSRLIAGIMQPGFHEAIVTLGHIGKTLDNVVAALEDVKTHSADSSSTSNREGYLIKRVLERRFSLMPTWLTELTGFLTYLCKDSGLMEDNEDLKRQIEEVLHWSKYLVGSGPLHLTSVTQLEQAAACFSGLQDRFGALVDSSAQISVGYCQNAYLEASGDIVVRGPLTYNCQVSAGSNLTIHGDCRSGCYYAREFIFAENVGTGSMGQTKLSVHPEGRIRAVVLNPGVLLKIGPIPYEVTTKMYKTEFRQKDGAIVTRSFT